MIKRPGRKNSRRTHSTPRSFSRKLSGKIQIPGYRTGGGVNLIDVFQRKWQSRKFSHLLTLGVVTLCLIGLFFWASYRFLLSSDIFGVYAITVHGNERIPETEITALSGIEMGKSLLLYKPETVAARIEKHNWVSKADVRRRFPSSIDIEVQAQKPLALINLHTTQESSLFYVDAHGVVFAPATGSEDLDFPVISGILQESLAMGMTIDAMTLTGKALQFIQLTADRNQAVLPVQSISEVRVNPEKGIIVYLAENPFPIYIGQDKIRENYTRLVTVLRKLYSKYKITEIAKIQMDYAEDQVLVTMVENYERNER